jgi:hypothetical protein
MRPTRCLKRHAFDRQAYKRHGHDRTAHKMTTSITDPTHSSGSTYRKVTKEKRSLTLGQFRYSLNFYFPRNQKKKKKKKLQ